MSVKKPCINYPSCTYTGKEQSPLRFGLSAEGYPVNSVIEGNDKHLWVVEMKNNKKVWVKKDEDFKITPEEPVIKSLATQEDINNDIEVTTSNVEKKTTDYNLYLSYRLKQLKESTEETDNKKNFNKVIEEWKIIKNKPEELKIILEEAKIYAQQKHEKKNMKNSISKKPEPEPSIKQQEETTTEPITEPITEPVVPEQNIVEVPAPKKTTRVSRTTKKSNTDTNDEVKQDGKTTVKKSTKKQKE